jgi:hypothetical protein
MTVDELDAWAKGLSDEQLTAVLYELRDRGHAVACYGANEFRALFDGELDEDFDMEEFMKEHRDQIEEVMCDSARSYFLAIAEDAFFEEEDKAAEPAKLWEAGNADSD